MNSRGNNQLALNVSITHASKDKTSISVGDKMISMDMV